MQHNPLARLTAWPFRGPDGIVTLLARGPMTTNSAEALRDLPLAGLGIIHVSEFLVRDAIRDGRLVPLLEAQHASEEVPVWALTAPGRLRLPRIGPSSIS